MNHDSSNQIDPLVISGLGIVSPLGAGRESSWSHLLAGDSAIQAGKKGLEARVVDFSPNGARSRMGDFALLAADEALRQAGLSETANRADLRIGCAVSQSKPLITSSLDSSLLLSGFFGWSADTLLPRYFSLNGPVTNVVAACATGLASLKMAEQWIRSGDCDVVLAGAAESSLNDFYRAGFQQLGVLVEGADRTRVCPFDRRRSGFAMGEGAAVMIVEKQSSALKRGVHPLAFLASVVLQQSSADALRFDENGETVSRLIDHTLQGHLLPDYVNAHGTGTVMNDRAETLGLKKSFGVNSKLIPVSSTKAATGHLLGAAGAVEAAFAILSLRDGRIPATLHLEESDPECDLDYIREGARRKNIASALTLSYGFGGQMGAALFKKYE